MEQAQLPEWESQMIDDAISQAEYRLEEEKTRARRTTGPRVPGIRAS